METKAIVQVLSDDLNRRAKKVKQYLMSVGNKWPYDEKNMWAIQNDMNVQTVNKYLRGEIGSLIIAEAIAEGARQHIDRKKKVA